MPGRRFSRRWPFKAFVLILVIAAPLIQLPVSHAGDEIAAGNDAMGKQLEAYQSLHNLVKAVQKRLDDYGYHPGPLDGIFGPQTRAALMAFQKDHQLKADGVIGIETLRKLDLIRRNN